MTNFLYYVWQLVFFHQDMLLHGQTVSSCLFGGVAAMRCGRRSQSCCRPPFIRHFFSTTARRRSWIECACVRARSSNVCVCFCCRLRPKDRPKCVREERMPKLLPTAYFGRRRRLRLPSVWKLRKKQKKANRPNERLFRLWRLRESSRRSSSQLPERKSSREKPFAPPPTTTANLPLPSRLLPPPPPLWVYERALSMEVHVLEELFFGERVTD